jgi:hypothetical protein
VCGGAYLAATLLPAVRPTFRQMDARRAEPVMPARHPATLALD